MQSTITPEIKNLCIDLFEQGVVKRTIYEKYCEMMKDPISYKSFVASLKRWRLERIADEFTLRSGTYPDFTPHGATVQVDKNGNIVQAWIKQHHDSPDAIAEIIEAIRENVQPVIVKAAMELPSDKMLEIPLYDMHFPLTDHKQVLRELLSVIEKDQWDEINIIIGQDLFHNDDFRGRTTSGRPIEKLSMTSAWNDAREFWYNVLVKSLQYSNHVNVIYSKGNHDETLAWAFVQMLKEMFPTVNFDDSLNRRKCIYWRGCFIGVTHGSESKSKPNDLRGQFTIDFAKEFAEAKVREIHVGHLHHEKEADNYGVMIRRLCTATPRDEWSDEEGYIGAHRRFMVFTWRPDRLSSIVYLYND